MTNQKTLKDHNGYDVPVTAISKYDLKRDIAVKKIAKKFSQAAEKLAALKSESLNITDSLYGELLKQYQIDGKDVSTMKGNCTFYSYDKALKIEINIGNKLEFDDKINLAKTFIDDYLAEITQGQNQDIITIVNNAFTTVRGKLDHKRILNLMSYQIKHPLWLKGMELLRESITTNHTKRYIQVFERNDAGEYKIINVQFSSI